MAGSSSRIAQLLKLLERAPTDAFLLYALALEHKKAGDFRAALEYLGRVISADPSAVEAYHQAGQVQEMLGDTAAARAAYEQGIAAANKKGDGHARAELQGAMDVLG